MRQFVDRVPEAKNVNLLAYVESLGYAPVSMKGSKAMFLSPLRSESSPSFSVYQYNGTWFWYDFGSGEKGDSIEFVKRYYQVSFSEALDILLGVTVAANPIRQDSADDQEANKIPWVRELYTNLVMTGKQPGGAYFQGKCVDYYPVMGAVTYTCKTGSYIGIPVPYVSRMRGLECRGLDGDRKTLGHKTIWLLKRDTSRILVTESILDALAGEIILMDKTMTLCALNGVAMVEQLEALVKKYKPAEVLLALDNDEPGLIAQEKAIKLIRPYSDITIVNDHKMVGLKDMHKLLLNIKQQQLQ